jgi:hypothetical protein
MIGICHNIFTHHIYIQDYFQHICQLQRCMDPALRDIVKEEAQIFLM